MSVIEGCRRGHSVSEKFVSKARTTQTNESHSAAYAVTDNDEAMETQLLQKECPIPKWAREGAPGQSKDS